MKKAITGCVKVRKTDLETDKNGIDYIATLRDGAEIGIDVKIREKGASRWWKNGEAELALELWSVYPDASNTGKKGWTLSEKTNVDLILYRFHETDSSKYYLLPYQILRMAFLHNGLDWIKKYPRKKQASEQWQSEAIFVPASVVINALAQEMQGFVD